MNFIEKLSLIIILAAFALGFVIYPKLPAQMAAHWNFAGMADGYVSKAPGVLLIPGVMGGLFALYRVMLKADPMRKNLAKSLPQLQYFLIALLLFFFYLFCLVLSWNLGFGFNMTQWILPAFSMLFIAIGQVVKDLEPNWTIGIRTPWTMSDKKVWKATHELGSKMFKVASMVILAGVFLPELGMQVFIASILMVALVPFVFSYWKYTQLN